MRSFAFLLLLLGLALPSSAQVVAWSTKVGQHTDESGGAISAWPNLFAGFTSAGSMTLSRLDPVTGDLVWRSATDQGTTAAVVQQSADRVHLFGTTPSGEARVYTFDANSGTLLETLDLGSFRIDWVRSIRYEGAAFVFGKNDHTAVLLRFDVPTRQVTWSRTAPMMTAVATDLDQLFALEASGAGYALQHIRKDTGALDQSQLIPGASSYLSKVREVRIDRSMFSTAGEGYVQIVLQGDAPGGRGRLVACWVKPSWSVIPWQYVDLSCPGYLAQLGYVGYGIGIREETASGSQKSFAYYLNPLAAIGTGTQRTLLGTYLHESGLQSVYLAGSRRDISSWRSNLGIAPVGLPVSVDGGMNVDDVPVAQADGGSELGRFVLFEARDQGQSSAYVMRTQTVSAWWGYVTGGNMANLTVSLSAPAVRPLTVKVSAVGDQPIGSGTQTVTFAVGEKSKTLEVLTAAVGTNQSAYVELSYNKIRQRVYGEVQRSVLSSFTLSRNYGRGGDVLTGTVRLNGHAPQGGLAVRIAESNQLVGTPLYVTVPHGEREATFPITLFAPAETGTVNISAIEYNVNILRTLTLLRSELHALSLSNAWVTGGTSLTMMIDLDAPAPAGGFECSVATEGAVLPRAPVTVPLGSRTAAAPLSTSVVTVDTPSIVSVSAQGRVRTKAVLVRP